jgi:hypothetical protein
MEGSVAKDYITPEEGVRLKELWEAYAQATRRGADAINNSGMSSEAFRKAEAETAEIIREIKQILGTAGRHWMS